MQSSTRISHILIWDILFDLDSLPLLLQNLPVYFTYVHTIVQFIENTRFYRKYMKIIAFASAFFNKLLLTTCADVECVNNERYLNIQMQPFTRVHSSCSTRHGTEKAWRWVRWECPSNFCCFFMLGLGTENWTFLPFFLAVFLVRIQWNRIWIQAFCESWTRFLTTKIQIKYSWKRLNVLVNKMQYFY